MGFYTLKYLEGIDYLSDAVDVAIKLGNVNQAGAWFSLIDIDTGELIEKFQGKPKLVDFLREHQTVFDTMMEHIERLENEN